MMDIKVNITDDKKDLVKAGNTTTMCKDVVGEKFVMTGIIIYEKEEINAETGEVKKSMVSCIKKQDGEFISTISPTVLNSLDIIVNCYTPEEIKKGIEIEVKSKKSNSKREFIYIDLV